MNHAAFIRTIATALLCATLGSASFALQAPSPSSTGSTDDPICTRQHCPIDGQPTSQRLPGQPMLVAPGCPACFRGTQSPEPQQSLPEPKLVAPNCGNGCQSPMASERLQDGEPIMVAPNCPSGCGMWGRQMTPIDGPILVAPDCSSVKCRLFNVGEAIVLTPATGQPKLPEPMVAGGGCRGTCSSPPPESLRVEPILVAPNCSSCRKTMPDRIEAA